MFPRSAPVIARLTGRLIEKAPHQVILDAGGVGYRVATPLSTYCGLPPEGSEITLRIHTHVREDAIALYGFGTRLEQDLFERLIEISGIGPRLGLSILSGLPAEELVAAIADGDGVRLRGIPGVGPKTADRIVLEMRDRVAALASAPAGAPGGSAPPGSGALRRDVVSALMNLGYPVPQAEEAVRRAASAAGEHDPEGDAPEMLQDLLKRSLRYLGSGRAREAR
jgi:Holliday junction DNA helicase RuvA